MVCLLLVALMLVSALPCGVQAASELSQGQENIVKRARQLLEIEWTPQKDIYQWGYDGIFEAGATYTGIPYGQPVHTGYVGFDVTLSEFLAAVNDSGSEFYSQYSYFNKIAPCYSMDCSGFVSYAWGLSSRITTSSIGDVAYEVDDQSIWSLEVGDSLNKAGSHMVLVSDVVRDSSGAVVSVQLMEETPNITRCIRYGQGGSRTLDQFKSYYLNSGYVIYRFSGRDSVHYVHDCAVPIDGDTCTACRASDVPFTDVRRGAWYQNAVRCVYENGLMGGTSNNRFSPGVSMTRGMFATAMSRLAGVDPELTGIIGITNGTNVRIRSQANTSSAILAVCEQATALEILGSSGNWYQVRHGGSIGYVRDDLINVYRYTLTDLRTDQYYSAGVQWAYLSGIVSGNSDGSFQAGREISREQMCVMLYNYAITCGLDLPTVQEKAAFWDDWSISSYAKSAVYALQKAGVIGGMGDGSFSPKATATRAQVAQIFTNFIAAVN
jgi:hypothetical protein